MRLDTEKVERKRFRLNTPFGWFVVILVLTSVALCSYVLIGSFVMQEE